MCVAFLYYYPKLELFFCGHHLNHSLAYDNFVQEHLRYLFMMLEVKGHTTVELIYYKLIEYTECTSSYVCFLTS